MSAPKTAPPTGAELLTLLQQAAEMGALPQHLTGYTFVFTGALTIKRDDLKSLVRVAGGRTEDRVVWGNRVVLVHGDTGRHGTTTKMREARARGSLVWTEAELCEKILKGI